MAKIRFEVSASDALDTAVVCEMSGCARWSCLKYHRYGLGWAQACA